MSIQSKKIKTHDDFAILHLQTAVVMELVKYVKLLLKQEETVIEIKRKITYNS